eukprot:CAMPEP_0197529532 /NCGR_PEP_ID=MMETSP1318-20131121/28675_1 /TAXON_ID=552666 /ORGANISM="Partenskyella glossopodia, Strain RCC365" /LENGTH=180 /DNA_ID=CAMNT_0043085027 /DNA_START=246 /DNA_END=788 /DNA_ORIENTATION=-
MIPEQAHSRYSPKSCDPEFSPNLATSVMLIPSKADTSNAEASILPRSSLAVSEPMSELHASGGTQKNVTLAFPSMRDISCRTEATSASSPASSPTSHLPARARIVVRIAGPETPEAFSALTTPSATFPSCPIDTRKLRPLSSGLELPPDPALLRDRLRTLTLAGRIAWGWGNGRGRNIGM